MKKFCEFIMEEKSHKNGTYVAANLSDESSKSLYKWVEDNKIDNPINYKLPDNEYHVTIAYSRKGIAAAKGEDIGLPITAKIVGWEIFNTQGGKKCLVARVEADRLTKAHKMYISKYGATYDYDEYKPHVTVSYDYNGSIPKETPDFGLVLDSRTFKALDPTYTPSNNKD